MDNKKEGNGIFYLEEGIYAGEVKNDLFHGKGIFSGKNGWKYEGEFVNGKKDGF